MTQGGKEEQKYNPLYSHNQKQQSIEIVDLKAILTHKS